MSAESAAFAVLYFLYLEVSNMLYRTLKRMIERGNIDGMAEKLDVFYAADKITAAEYTELTAMLAEK